MEIVPHLNFNGQCREAFETYEKVLGGKITLMMTWGETPLAKGVPPDWAKKITHATFEILPQTALFTC